MSTINANTRGGLTVDRESLHASDGYKRQIDSLRQLQQGKPMSTEELRKAVERLDGYMRTLPEGNQRHWSLITKALRDQEAEIAGYRLQERQRIAEAVALASRAEKAEALLREIRDSTHKSALMLRAMADRYLTAHLGGEHD